MPFLGSEDAPLWLNALVFAGAAVIVWVAGTRLTHVLDDLSIKTGLGGAFVGMLFLGGITSLPEVANVITASMRGVPQLATSNLLGSAAINVFLLAIADAIFGRGAITSMVARPGTLMMCALCMLILCLIALAVTTGDVPILGVGGWSIAICLLSILFFAMATGYNARSPWTVRDEADGGDREDEVSPKASLAWLIVWTAIAGAVIFAAGYTLSTTGEALAVQTGLGAGMVGFLLIGLATSLPELSSISAAIRLKRHEMAFGQVIGTNFVNLSLFLLADALYAGEPVISLLGRFEVVAALLGLALVGVFLVGLLERRDPKFVRMGYDSLAVLLLFPAGVVLLYLSR